MIKTYLKKSIAFLLATVLLFAAGCSPGQDSPAPESAASGFDVIEDVNSTVKGNAQRAEIHYYPSEPPEGVNVLKWILINQERVSLDEEVVGVFNQALKEKNLPYQVQWIQISGDEEDVLSAFETQFAKEADLISAGDITETLIDNGTFLPLNEWMENGDGGFLNELLVWDKDWIKASKGGERFGIPTSTEIASGPAWSLKPKIIDEYGMQRESFQKRLWELDDEFQEIYQKNDNTPFMGYEDSDFETGPQGGELLCYSSLLYYTRYDFEYITSAVGIDWQGDKPAVVNVYDTEYMKKTVEAWQRYYHNGFLFDREEESLTDLVSPSIGYSLEMSKVMDRDNKKVDSYLVPAGKTYIRSGSLKPSTFVGISKASSKQQQALDCIQQLYTQQDLKNLLAFGVEGKNYTLSNGIMTPIEESEYDGRSLVYGYEFAPFQLWENHFLIPQREGMTTKEAHREDLQEARLDPYSQTQWDLSRIQKEYKETESVIKKDLEKLIRNLEAGTAVQWLEKLQENLKNAGVDALVKELNCQGDDAKG